MSRRSDFLQWLRFEEMRFWDEFRRHSHLDSVWHFVFSCFGLYFCCCFMGTRMVSYPVTGIVLINNMKGWLVIRMCAVKDHWIQVLSRFFFSFFLVCLFRFSIAKHPLDQLFNAWIRASHSHLLKGHQKKNSGRNYYEIHSNGQQPTRKNVEMKRKQKKKNRRKIPFFDVKSFVYRCSFKK